MARNSTSGTRCTRCGGLRASYCVHVSGPVNKPPAWGDEPGREILRSPKNPKPVFASVLPLARPVRPKIRKKACPRSLCKSRVASAIIIHRTHSLRSATGARRARSGQLARAAK